MLIPAEVKNVLLTGPPRCGKTTAIQRFLETIAGQPVTGFITQEVREEGRRVGFLCLGLASGLGCQLAHVESASSQRVGRYGVHPDRLDPLLDRELVGIPADVAVAVIDEIGAMELLNPRFEPIVRDVLSGPSLVVGSVAQAGSGLIEAVRAFTGTIVLPVTEANRDEVPAALLEWLAAKRPSEGRVG